MKRLAKTHSNQDFVMVPRCGPGRPVDGCNMVKPDQGLEGMGTWKDVPLPKFLGLHVKKLFKFRGEGERMWVKVTRVDGGVLHGTVDSVPFVIKHLYEKEVRVPRADVIEAGRWCHGGFKFMSVDEVNRRPDTDTGVKKPSSIRRRK